jgi:anti-anti-sigma factor
VLTLAGDFDQPECDAVAHVVRTWSRPPRHRVLLDAEGVTFAGSALLLTLLALREAVVAQLGSLTITPSSRRIWRLLEATDLDELFDPAPPGSRTNC